MPKTPKDSKGGKSQSDPNAPKIPKKCSNCKVKEVKWGQCVDCFKLTPKYNPKHYAEKINKIELRDDDDDE